MSSMAFLLAVIFFADVLTSFITLNEFDKYAVPLIIREMKWLSQIHTPLTLRMFSFTCRLHYYGKYQPFASPGSLAFIKAKASLQLLQVLTYGGETCLQAMPVAAWRLFIRLRSMTLAALLLHRL